jgi:predicted  nucleic acid-binding Zn-ribbon protein
MTKIQNLIDNLKSLNSTVKRTIDNVKNEQMHKRKRINALQERRHELLNTTRGIVTQIDAEIRRIRARDTQKNRPNDHEGHHTDVPQQTRLQAAHAGRGKDTAH